MAMPERERGLSKRNCYNGVETFRHSQRHKTMNNEDEYRRNAAEAQSQADRALSDVNRAAWLRIAQGWLSMIRSRPQTAQEKFDQVVSEKGTGQDQSKSSN
jgi:hypothetical protein